MPFLVRVEWAGVAGGCRRRPGLPRSGDPTIIIRPARLLRFPVVFGFVLAGVAGASFLLSSLGRGANKEAESLTQEFPDQDSIFHPARDPRLDPRRYRSG